MASRSGGSNEKETAILSVAGSGLRGERPGCLVATTSRHEGGEGILPQTPEKIRLHSTGHRHRLAKKLRSGKKANTEECKASTTSGLEQSSREFSSAYTSTTTRATKAEIQIT